MRLVLDLQACQTASRKRGIGRYSLELGRALRDRTELQIQTLFDATRSRAGMDARHALAPFGVDTPSSLVHYVPPRTGGDDLSPYAVLADYSYRRHVGGLGADALHVSSVFEGFIEPVVPLLRPDQLPAHILTSATLYDLIPLLFSDQYLAEPVVRAWYERRLATLKQFDVLLAISESSRQDAISLLDIEPDRVVNVSGAADLSFYGVADDPEDLRAVREKFGIGERFVLYTGNGDFRKNLERTIVAFAQLPKEVLQGCQLVLNQGDEGGALTELARKLQLPRSAVICTGFIDDRELRALYQACTLFVFPSLYEGFGLPVLEAMACGAPVMAADNSSLVEILPRRDALFDGSSTAAISAAMARGLGDSAFRRVLSAYGLARAKEFSWERSAELASQALRDARSRKLQGACVSVPGRRIAYVSPLPPERSGIADYSADLLPELGRIFRVDLFVRDEADADPWREQGFTVHSWRDLESMAHHYAQVVYQFGNSQFHTHMFELLENVPGIVVLHDVFLSDVIEHEDRYGGHAGWLSAELRHSHGRFDCPPASEDEGRRRIRKYFPCSRSVVEAATALFVHSADARALVRTWYPWSTGTPTFQVPAIRAPVPESEGCARRNFARARLGIGDGEFLVCSFGYLSDTKRSDQLAAAFARSALAVGNMSRLVFVGEGAGGDWGEGFSRLVDSIPASIQVSGFVDQRSYLDYLAACDLAIQLRADSRGESSRAVLDSLAFGVPTIVNDYAFFAEIPGAVVHKLSATCSVDEIARAIDGLASDCVERGRLRDAGPAYILATHGPQVVAQAYARAINLCAVRPAAADQTQELVGMLAQAFEHSEASHGELACMAMAAVRNQPPLGPLRLLVDVSDVHYNDYGTGIHRVVRNLVRELCTGAAPAYVHARPVRADAGQWLAANQFLRRLQLDGGSADHEIALGRNDAIVLLDSSWDDAPGRFDQLLDRADELGLPVCGVVYDLIPVRHPEMCVDAMPPVFEGWLRWLVSRASSIACISRATADDLRAYIKEHRLPHREGLQIGHFPMGADLVESCSGEVPDALLQAFDGSQSTFLAVGTVEPRKRYDLILDAFEQCWEAGEEIRLVVVGKPGWNAAATVARLQTHPESGRRLHWFDSLSDAGLTTAYRNASALVQASIAEGFGLPLIEAMHHGVHTIATDIPVFREVTGGHGWFFRSDDPGALARALRRPLPPAPVEARNPVTWRESAREFAALMASAPSAVALG